VFIFLFSLIELCSIHVQRFYSCFGVFFLVCALCRVSMYVLMIFSEGELTYGLDLLSAYQAKIKEAEDCIADLKDTSAKLRNEVTQSLV